MVEPYSLPGLGETAPGRIVRPEAVEELAEALRSAWAGHVPVRPWGGGTQMVLGEPVRPGPQEVVDLSGLDQVVELRPEDMTVTVQAGVRWGDLRDLLAGVGHELPCDPPVSPEATVGGMTAAGLSGPRRLAHGRLRDWLLGVQAVRPSGSVTRAGGRVVKNVSGYELTKLYAGSLGTLGVLTELTFKTRPLAPSRRAVAVLLPGFQAVEPVVARVMDSPVEPAFLEIFWMSPDSTGPEALGSAAPTSPGLAMARLLTTRLGLSPDEAGSGLPWLLAGFEGTDRRTAWQVDTLGRFLIEARAAQATAASGQGSGGPEFFHPCPLPWEAVHAALLEGYRLPPPVEAREATLFASLQSSQVAEYLATVQSAAGRRGLAASVFAHAGNGGVAIHLLGAVDPLLAAAEELRREAERLQGALVLRHGPVALRRTFPVWGRPPSTLPLMRALKEKLDPHGILNPGRFVGGL